MAAEQAKPRGVGRVSEDDLPYAGMMGRTRSEAVQVLMPDGSLQSLSVYTGIDAVADPALAALARAGTLHHVAEGVELALPFTYHDPVARLFVLVLPDGLRHRALALRAEVMLALATDARHPVPGYARDVELVVGTRGLAARLDAGVAKLVLVDADEVQVASVRALAERERELQQRERLIEARERALHSSAPKLAPIHEITTTSCTTHKKASRPTNTATSSRRSRTSTPGMPISRTRAATKKARPATQATSSSSRTRATRSPSTNSRSHRPRSRLSSWGSSFG
jgi:hypothetical protein